MGKSTTNKDMAKVVANLQRQGWTIKKGGKHDKLVSPDGRSSIPISRTPSDHRSAANLAHQAQRIMVRKDQ